MTRKRLEQLDRDETKAWLDLPGSGITHETTIDELAEMADIARENARNDDGIELSDELDEILWDYRYDKRAHWEMTRGCDIETVRDGEGWRYAITTADGIVGQGWAAGHRALAHDAALRHIQAYLPDLGDKR